MNHLTNWDKLPSALKLEFKGQPPLVLKFDEIIGIKCSDEWIDCELVCAKLYTTYGDCAFVCTTGERAGIKQVVMGIE